MTETFLTRRACVLGLPAASLAGCASAPPLLINLADVPAPPPAQSGDSVIGAGSDLVGRLTAPVMVNGRGPFPFVVDTGANRTVVSAELAAELGLPDAGPAKVHGIAGAEDARTVLVERLEIDNLTTRIARSPVLSAERLGAAGLLGVDAMAGRRITLDFRRRQMRMQPSSGGDEGTSIGMRRASTGAMATTGQSKGVVASARYRFGQLVIVGADVSGRKIMAFLDSGAQSTVGNMALLSRVNAGEQGHRAGTLETTLLSATGQKATGQYGVIPRLKLGGLTIDGLGAVFAPLHIFDLWDLAKSPSVLIGIDVMSQFEAIELDYGRRRIVFYPSARRNPRRGS